MKKLWNLSSPWGIALTAAGVFLALSPDARKATRRMLVRGTAGLLGAMDMVRGSGNQQAEITFGMAGAAKLGDGNDVKSDTTSRQSEQVSDDFTDTLDDLVTEGLDAEEIADTMMKSVSGNKSQESTSHHTH